tara:strand:+ start:297 stop:401 length:105 start_codon:yes stop_codon:yes gene_type:complete
MPGMWIYQLLIKKTALPVGERGENTHLGLENLRG